MITKSNLNIYNRPDQYAFGRKLDFRSTRQTPPEDTPALCPTKRASHWPPLNAPPSETVLVPHLTWKWCRIKTISWINKCIFIENHRK